MNRDPASIRIVVVIIIIVGFVDRSPVSVLRLTGFGFRVGLNLPRLLFKI
jgi:hypothetical protein